MCVLTSQSSMSISHKRPVIPLMQTHVKLATLSRQVDPFEQGLAAHSSISVLQSLPL